MTTTYNLTYRESRTYIISAIFVAGNILLPQLCHLMPQGGLIWLPIYFFTLVAAYKFGMTAGLLTAVLSPVVNNILFGMPPAPMLPIILIKSVLLALSASIIAGKMRKVNIFAIALAVILAQFVGSIAEWGMTGSLSAALQDVSLGLPGILFQIFGGYLVCRLSGFKD